jgi:hypothetical protein
MGLQISAATGLLIVSLTMTAQASFIENRWLGFETKDRYQVFAPCPFPAQMPQEELAKMQTRCRTGVRTILSRATDISQPAFFDGLLIGGEPALQPFGRSAKGEKLGEATIMRADLDFLQTMGSRLVAGRMFDAASAYDKALSDYNTAMQARMKTTVQSDGQGRTMIFMTSDDSGPGPVRPARVPVVVTTAILSSLGVQTPDEAIGQQIATQPNSQYALEVIGVVEDWNSRPLKFAVTPIIFMPQGGAQAVVQIGKDSLESVQTQLTQAWRDYLGNAPNATVQLRPLAQTLEASYRTDFQLMRAVTTFALVAIAVAGLGVYGLSAFEMRRRVREIGIRKALGASPYAVGALAIGRALIFAAIAALVAWAPGFGVANAWLSDFVYRTSLSWLVLPIATAIVVAFVALAVTLSAVRAAAIRPGLALRV